MRILLLPLVYKAAPYSGAASLLPHCCISCISQAVPYLHQTCHHMLLQQLASCLQVGTPTPCQQYLQSSWAVCSNAVQLGSGQGSVAVRLPQPSAVANFTAIPGSITSSDDPARLNPILVATSSSLVLQIAFADGVVRDFSKDRRVAYGLAPGSTMCEVVKGEHTH